MGKLEGVCRPFVIKLREPKGLLIRGLNRNASYESVFKWL